MNSEANNISGSNDNQLELNELRDKVYAALKKIYGGMRGAAQHANCSEYQLRLILKGVDTNPVVLEKAAEWLQLHQSQQAEATNRFVVVATHALSM